MPGLAINVRRTIAILEHTQLAISMIAEGDYPDDAPHLLRMAFDNLDEYHR